jgi:endonuclease III
MSFRLKTSLFALQHGLCRSASLEHVRQALVSLFARKKWGKAPSFVLFHGQFTAVIALSQHASAVPADAAGAAQESVCYNAGPAAAANPQNTP